MAVEAGVAAAEVVEALTGEAVDLAIGDGADAGVAPFVGEERAFAEEGAGTVAVDHLAIDEDLGLARAQEVHRVAVFTLVDDGVAGKEDHGLEDLDDLADEEVAGAAKERDLAQDIAVEEEGEVDAEGVGQLVEEGAGGDGLMGLPEVAVVAADALLKGSGDVAGFQEEVDLFHFLQVSGASGVEVGDEGGDVADDVAVHADSEEHDDHGEGELEGCTLVGGDVAVADGGEGGDGPVEGDGVGLLGRQAGGDAADQDPTQGDEVGTEQDPEEEKDQAEDRGVEAEIFLEGGGEAVELEELEEGQQAEGDGERGGGELGQGNPEGEEEIG